MAGACQEVFTIGMSKQQHLEKKYYTLNSTKKYKMILLSFTHDLVGHNIYA